MNFGNRRTALAAGAVIAWLLTPHAARADHWPVFAMPGHPDVPVVVDGIPATGALVSGNWGLYLPGQIPPQVLAPLYVPAPRRHPRYFPHADVWPRTGRQEVTGPRYQPPPAPSYFREWNAGSGNEPATVSPQYETPPVIVEPQVGPRGWPARP